MKNYLLTDFTTKRWEGIDIESVRLQIDKLNETINKIGCIFGEIGNPLTLEFHLQNVSHLIKNLTFSEGKVYGDIELLDTQMGRIAKTLINNMNYKLGIRSNEQLKDGKIFIEKIFTWDIIIEKNDDPLIIETSNIEQSGIDPYGEEIWD